MSMQAFIGILVVTLLLWNIVSRQLSSTRSPLSSIAGPRKEHWLTGRPHLLLRYTECAADLPTFQVTTIVSLRMVGTIASVSSRSMGALSRCTGSLG